MQRNDLLGVVVATFANRACADEAIRDLHHAGARHTWLGMAKSREGTFGPELVEDLGIARVVARWLHQDREETLYEALCEHGVAEAAAKRIDGTVPEGNCVLVVEDVLSPTVAASVVVRHGGTMLITPDDLDPTAVRSAHDPMIETRAEAARRHPARH